jgi:hypothetical protein
MCAALGDVEGSASARWCSCGAGLLQLQAALSGGVDVAAVPQNNMDFDDSSGRGANDGRLRCLMSCCLEVC